MEKPLPSPQGPRLRFDLSQVEEQLDEIISRADERLSLLNSESALQGYYDNVLAPYIATVLAEPTIEQDSTETSPIRREESVSYQLRLGSASLTLEELRNLSIDAIVPLQNASNGRIQIWANERLCGLGTLLVADGKLIVQIESIERP